MKKQNGFAWPLALFSKKSEKISIAVSFDETALNEKIQNLQAVTAEQIPAENAKPELQGDTYVIKEEVIWNGSRYGCTEGKSEPVYFRISIRTGLWRRKDAMHVRNTQKIPRKCRLPVIR